MTKQSDKAKSGGNAAADDGYRIGKGQPPREHCFPKGVSGNPKGRPKGSKNMSTIMKGVLNTRIDTVKNGKRTTVTVKEAAGLKLAKKALDGDFRSIVEVLRHAVALDQELAAIPSQTSTADADIIKVFAQRVLSGAIAVPDDTPSPDSDPEGDAP
jgi:Family of unknown function (DUF5681)